MKQNQFINEDIWQYCEENTKSLSSNLENLKQDTVENVFGSQMLSEKIVTKILQFLVFATNAKICVDIGTYTGFSAMAMADICSKNSIIYTIDKPNQTGFETAKKHLSKYENIKMINNEAINEIPNLPNNIDIAFIDADKMQTQKYFDMLINKVSKNGIIVVDDVLWRGEVLNPTDKRAKALDNFNKNIATRNDVDNILLPIRHGINIVRKK